MLQLVPTTRTPFGISDFTKALIYAWYQIYNALPTREQIAVIFSQWALETGLGSSCWNFNIGNIKAVDAPDQTITYCMLENVWEIVNGKKVMFQPPNPATWFRAFDTLDAGVAFQLAFLRNKRYHVAWSAVEQGNPALFAHLLKEAGYYTAPEADYVRAMQYHFAQFNKIGIFENVLSAAEIDIGSISLPPDYQPLDGYTRAL